MKYKRVLLKLSGEVLAGDQGFGLNFRAIESMCRQIAQVAEDGIQIGLVVGGVEVENIGTTSKTLPGFADMWAEVVAQ